MNTGEEEASSVYTRGGKNAFLISDIGAGDGEVTMRLAKAVARMQYNIVMKVFATESSFTMKDRLTEKKFM